MIETPSPNFDERTLPTSILVLHYTGMPDAPSAIQWLANPESKVSAHYVVTEDGQIVRMVDESKRAWHAGRSYWRGTTDINSASVGITRGNVVGHSDIAPSRKQDPGELFPWHKLARLRLALPRPTRNLMDPHWTDSGFMLALERFGYDISEPQAAVTAFQRRFRPELIDGVIDGECRAILLALLLPRPRGDD
jgi:N-acetylmuramoyl-L-alanine amidase